jgi:hypothetical protein
VAADRPADHDHHALTVARRVLPHVLQLDSQEAAEGAA